MDRETVPCGTVTVTGRTNVGKSTLLNALLDEKVSIVTRKAQTTRYRIRGILNRTDYQIIFTDTPGVHKPHGELGRQLNSRVYETWGKSDLILFVFDAASGWGTGDEFVDVKLREHEVPVILVPNKIDELTDTELDDQLETVRNHRAWDRIVPVSATRETNLDQLLEAIVENLPEGPRLYPEDTLVDRDLVFRISEIIREKTMQVTREEVPHSIEVTVDRFEDGEDPDVKVVEATVFVERDSQKGIVIGKGGERIKKIGRDARDDVEELLDSKAYLDLHVSVLEDWTEDAKKIRNLEHRKGN